MKGGVLLVDKEAGMSSARCVSVLKRNLKHVKKIGHAGTLDPMATGLLVCLVNSATRLAQYVESGEKIYSGTIQLGVVTDSDDITGRILARREVAVSEEQIQQAVQSLSGEFAQVPPQISAVKVDGKRAYRRVRDGERVELRARNIIIREFDLRPCDREEPAAHIYRYRIRCSKGTYVRSIARDLGELLGCGACLASIHREYSHPFKVSDAKKLQELSFDDILPWERMFPEVPRIAFSDKELRRLQSGDQRVLRERHGEISRVAGTQLGVRKSACALYGADLSGPALGVLACQEGVWQLAMNVNE